MANLMYGVCVRMALGYCSIEWSESKTNSFLVTGNLGAISINDPGGKFKNNSKFFFFNLKIKSIKII